MTTYRIGRGDFGQGWWCGGCDAAGDGLEDAVRASSAARAHIRSVHGNEGEQSDAADPGLDDLSAAITRVEAALGALARPARAWPVAAGACTTLADLGLRLRGLRELLRERTTGIQADLEQGE